MIRNDDFIILKKTMQKLAIKLSKTQTMRKATKKKQLSRYVHFGTR